MDIYEVFFYVLIAALTLSVRSYQITSHSQLKLHSWGKRNRIVAEYSAIGSLQLFNMDCPPVVYSNQSLRSKIAQENECSTHNQYQTNPWNQQKVIVCAKKTLMKDAFFQCQQFSVLHDLSISSLVLEALVTTMKERKCCSVSLRHPAGIDAFSQLKSRIVKNNSDCLVGASTVVSLDQIDELHQHNVDFISTTFFSRTLVKYAHKNSIPVLCGVSSYEEAYEALCNEVEALKFYPASIVTPRHLQEILMKLDIPKNFGSIPVIVAGGVKADSMREYLNNGANGFAVGVNCKNVMTILSS